MQLSRTKMSNRCIQFAVLISLLIWPQKYVLGFYAQPDALLFTVSPADVITCEGCGQVMLTCGIPRQQTAANVPEPELQWMFNGSTVPPGAQVELLSNDSLLLSHLIISTLQTKQSGLYRCVAIDGDKDSYCRTSKLPCVPTMTLSNEARVQIISNAVCQPITVSYSNTDSVRQISLTVCSTTLLACRPNYLESFIDEDKYHIEWRNDGNDLNITSEYILQSPNGDLVLSNLGGSNTGISGLYDCSMIFFNDSGVQSNVTVARYRVNTNESISGSSGNNNASVAVVSSQTVYLEGETATLVCVFNLHSENVSSCLNRTGTTWYFDRDRIKDASAGRIPENNILILHSTLLEDSGNYCCSLEVDNETYQDCIMISILPQANPSLPISDNPTVFVDSSVNNTLQITSFYSAPSQLVWYYNGVELNEQRGNDTLVRSSNANDLYGMYQCFVAVLGFPQILVKGTRVMPHNRTNPPGPTDYKEVVRATHDRSKAPLLVSWQPPLYIGNLTHIGYQLYNQYGTPLGFTFDNSMVINLTLFLAYSVTVEGRDPEDNSVRVSDRSSGGFDTFNPNCNAFNFRQVLFPPSLSLSCNDGSVSLTILDNESNSNRYSSRVYYIQGTCMDSNETTYINQKLSTTGVRLMHPFRLGTHCTLQAAASTEDFSTCHDDCSCLDPDLIEYSQPSQCIVTAEVNIIPMIQLVNEDNMSVEVCVTIGTFVVLETNMMITLDTSSGTAIAGVDFDDFHTDLYLNEEKTTTCINITVRDDNVLETGEYFLVEISNYDPNIQIINGLARINIQDNDHANVSLFQAVYSVSEQDIFLTLCIEVVGHLEKDITTVMDSSDGRAIEGMDYEGLHAELHLNGTATTACVTVTILEDEILEGLESFLVVLSTTDPAVNIIERNTEVVILDNDSVNVSISMTNSVVSEEDMSVEFCVMVVGLLDKIVNINVDSNNGSAIEGMDYKGLHVELHLNGTATTACVNVTILEDEILEVLESFFVVLSTTDPAVNIMERNTEVVIQDNDSVNVSISMTNSVVSEEDMSVELCVNVVGLLDKIINITVDSDDGRAIEGVDYEGLHVALYLHGTATTACVNVIILEDEILEGLESFFVVLSTTDPAVNIMESNTEVVIQDNNSVNVSISMTNSIVSEEDMSVELCVKVAGLLDKIVNITVDSNNGSAVEGMDYEGLHAKLHFNGTATTACVNVTIREDETLEGSESFFVVLSTTDPAVNIVERNMEVVILDNNSVNVSISMTNSNVSEEDMSVEFCVMVVGLLDKIVIINVDSNSGSAIEGMDYEGLHVELHLNGTATTACINVTILEDEILEGPESFFVVLSTTDPAVNIMERNTEVVILDNDTSSIEGAFIGIVSAVALFLFVVLLTLCLTYSCVTYGNRKTYALKQMSMFKWKDQQGESDYSDDPVHVSPDPPFIIDEEDDAESIYELYDPEGKQPPKVNVEHPNCFIGHWNTLEREILEKHTEECLREVHVTSSSDVKTLDGYRKISDSSGFSDDSHYVRYPLNYTFNEATTTEAAIGKYLTQHPMSTMHTHNHSQLKRIAVSRDDGHNIETDV